MLNKIFLKELTQKPFFCFVIHTDWASESILEETIDFFEKKKILLTPYITNNSEIINKKYKGEKKKYVGLHPNFLPNSSHGDNYDDVIEHVFNMWPEAKSFASHCFFDNFLITDKFFNKGISYDSNICLHLQPNLVPLQHSSGLLRFPVFFEDDVYARLKGDWNFSSIKDLFETPGLKLINFHPTHICLNTPDFDFYNQAKNKSLENWRDIVYKGKGTRTFIEEIVNHINDSSYITYYLDDLFLMATRK